MKINKISLTGELQLNAEATQSAEDVITLKSSYIVGGGIRGGGEKHDIVLDDNHLVELVFDDDTTWLCSTDSLEEIFPEAAVQSRAGDGSFVIPSSIRSGDSERGIISDIVLKVFNVFTKNKVAKKVQDVAADLEKKQLENQSGLYRVDANFQLQKFTPVKSDKPYLLFIHGTNSSTKGSFSELINTDLWNHIQQNYGNNVLALQHETLTKSPLQNVLDLVPQLPQNASLHLITHSRGGLVGDTLARFCNSDDNNRGFSKDEIKYLEKTNRTNDVDVISKIKALLVNKKIIVSKYVRVACPASGTTILAKRLDNFFNITFNLIGFGTGLISNPVYATFKSMIASVINCKNDVDVLPGLEAMNPDSPFIKVLNSPGTEVTSDNSLVVVSGNCKVKLNLKALVIIASKLFYVQDNDLVVNTTSMYMGTKRTGRVQYFFDAGVEVDHFHYFKNKRTNDAIMQALKTADDALIPGFTLLDRDSLAAVQRNAVLEGGQVSKSTITGTRPILIVLPGIMGSNLAQNDKLLWINYFRFLGGDLVKIDIKNTLTTPSIIKTSYKQLVDHFDDKYDVITFAFDWRQQLNDVAVKLNEEIKRLLAYQQPIKIIGHSMGGVLVRDFIINHDDTWQKLNSSPGFRLIFLGAPLGGSFRIPAVLFGKDSIIDKLAKIDIFHKKTELLKVFSKMPGLLSLLPVTTDKENDFAKPDTWTRMSVPFNKPVNGRPVEDWPLPDVKDLGDFEKYRNYINEKMEDLDFSNMAYIAGKDKSTPCGYRMEEGNTGEELVFLSTGEGDQSVTWESGIPRKMIGNNSVYYVNVSHGGLANEPGIFNGINDILSSGSTNLLSRTRPTVRGEERLFKMPELHDFDISPDGIENTILGLTTQETQAVSDTPVLVSISNGDLSYSAYPLLAGHFFGDGILYAEKSIDANLEGALSERHQLGLYPGEIGTSEVMISADNDFKGAVIVGLGSLGDLTAFLLTQTIEQGVTNYLLNLNTQGIVRNSLLKNMPTIGISALIIGCGYGGLTVETSVRSIIQGVQNANEKLKKVQGVNAKLIQQIEFIEQYEDKALGCFYSLNRIANEKDRYLNIATERKNIKKIFGSKTRLPDESTNEWWNRITVQMDNKKDAPDAVRCMKFSISTGGAREEQRELYTSSPVLEQLIDEISVNNRWSDVLAKTIFELLIPNDFKEQLKRQRNINWILDKYTAAFPWELLQDSTMNAKPLSVNAGMIRQMTTQDSRLIIKAVATNNALVIGDPDLKGFITQLNGALEEGKKVSSLFLSKGFDTTTVLNGSAPEIIQSLFSKEYKIIHLAGHGIFNEKSPESSGMVIGNKVYLTTFEICQMSTVPDLVFVNCCFLGKTDGAAEEYYRNRYRLAANIGTQLIDNGVKAVVVAGWAVDDAAALKFTEVFYENMFAGNSFGDAVRDARQAVYEKYKTSNNTWGAYQCYGDPFYKFRINAPITNTNWYYTFVIAEEALIQLNNLHNTLETGKKDYDDIMNQMKAIAAAVDKAAIRNAQITEKEAFIYVDLGEYNLAIMKFESLLSMEDASFSVTTLERYCNVRAKRYVQEFLEKNAKPAALLIKMDKVLKDLDGLFALSITAERYNLMGGTLVRKAFITGTAAEKIRCYKEAAFYYMKSSSVKGSSNKSYGLTNWYQVESLLSMFLKEKRNWNTTITFKNEKYDLPSMESVIRELTKKEAEIQSSQQNMDYWQMVSAANIKLCKLIVHPPASASQKEWDEVLNAYRRLWKKAGPRGKRDTEIEHLEMLIDGLSLINNRNVNALRKKIEQLKDELKKMMQ